MFREVRPRPGRRGGDALIAADNFKLFAGAGAGGWKWSVTSGLGSDVIRHQPTTDPYLVTRGQCQVTKLQRLSLSQAATSVHSLLWAENRTKCSDIKYDRG